MPALISLGVIGAVPGSETELRGKGEIAELFERVIGALGGSISITGSSIRSPLRTFGTLRKLRGCMEWSAVLSGISMGTVLTVAWLVYKLANHRACRSTCCGRSVTASLDVGASPYAPSDAIVLPSPSRTMPPSGVHGVPIGPPQRSETLEIH